MTQIVINIEDTSILPSLKKVLCALKGVSIAKTISHRKNGIDEALEDVKAGRVTEYASVDEMFEKLGIKI